MRMRTRNGTVGTWSKLQLYRQLGILNNIFPGIFWQEWRAWNNIDKVKLTPMSEPASKFFPVVAV